MHMHPQLQVWTCYSARCYDYIQGWLEMCTVVHSEELVDNTIRIGWLDQITLGQDCIPMMLLVVIRLCLPV